MTVILNLKCLYTGKEYSQEINPLAEFFRKNPLGEIADWISLRGNELYDTQLELVSYSVVR